MIRTYAGENDAVRLVAVKKAVAVFVAKYTDMELERLDGDEASFDRITESVQSLPFLAERKMVVLKNPSLNKDFTEKFDIFLNAVTDSTDVLIVERKLDKRTSFYKQLQKKTEFTDFKILDVNGLIRYASEYAKDQGGVLSLGDARYLIDRVGLNQQTVQNEIDKLVLYSPRVTRQSIELLTDQLPQSRIFDLLDAAFSGDMKRLLEIYRDQRAQSVEPQMIISMIIWQLYNFAIVKAAKGKTTQEIAKSAKLNPFVVEKTQAAARNMTLVRLRQLITELRVLDVRSKTTGIILDDALQYFLLHIT